MQVCGISVYSLYWCLRRKAIHQKSNRCSFQPTGFRWLGRPPWDNQWKHWWCETNINLELCVCSRDRTGEFLFMIITDWSILVSVLVKRSVLHIFVSLFNICPILSFTVRKCLVLFYHAPCLMKIWTTGTYWNQQKRYCILWCCCCFMMHSCTCTGYYRNFQ